MTETDLQFALRRARAKCLGLPSETYEFADYLSWHLHRAIYPFGMTMSILFAVGDLEDGIHRDFYGETNLPPSLFFRRKQILPYAKFILQVLDCITEPTFANAVRQKCQDILGWRVTSRITIHTSSDEDFYQKLFEDNIKIATEWWSGAIQCSATHTFTEDEIKSFRGSLALHIANELKMYDSVELTTCNDGPNYLLYGAADAAGVDKTTLHSIFPENVQMFVDNRTVQIYKNQNPNPETIWAHAKTSA